MGSIVTFVEASDAMHVSSQAFELNILHDFMEMIALKLLRLCGAAVITLDWLCHALWRSWLDKVERVRSRDVSTQTVGGSGSLNGKGPRRSWS